MTGALAFIKTGVWLFAIYSTIHINGKGKRMKAGGVEYGTNTDKKAKIAKKRFKRDKDIGKRRLN
jgi:hypothetical protein